jgi:hypothetical protein
MEENLKKEIIELLKELNHQDSIEIGNSKTGTIKVYVDFSRKEEAEARLKNAIEVLKNNRAEVLG